VLAARTVAVHLERVHSTAVLGHEPPQQLHVKLVADARQVPQRMIEDDEHTWLTFEHLENVIERPRCSPSRVPRKHLRVRRGRFCTPRCKKPSWNGTVHSTEIGATLGFFACTSSAASIVLWSVIDTRGWMPSSCRICPVSDDSTSSPLTGGRQQALLKSTGSA